MARTPGPYAGTGVADIDEHAFSGCRRSSGPRPTRRWTRLKILAKPLTTRTRSSWSCSRRCGGASPTSRPAGSGRAAGGAAAVAVGQAAQSGAKALSMGRGPRPRGADPAVRSAGPDRGAAGAARTAAGRGGEAHPRVAAAAGQVESFGPARRSRRPIPRRGPDPDQRGVLRDLRGDERRRSRGAAARTRPPRCRPARRYRRAAGLRRTGRRDRHRHGQHHPSLTGWPRPPTSSPSWP